MSKGKVIIRMNLVIIWVFKFVKKQNKEFGLLAHVTRQYLPKPFPAVVKCDPRSDSQEH